MSTTVLVRPQLEVKKTWGGGERALMLRLGDGPFNSPTQFHFQPPVQGTGVLAGLGNVETTDFIICLQCQVSFKDRFQDIMMSLLKICWY